MVARLSFILMKRIKRILLLLAATALTTVANAQTINGDLNHNNRLDMADMTKLLNNYLTGTVETYTTPTVTIGDNGNWFIDGVDTGKPSRGQDGYNGLTPTIGSNGDWFIGSIDTGVSAVNKTDPFDTANSLVVGTWYKSPTESITFGSNGTTDYLDGHTYQFLPFQGRILFFNASGLPAASLHVTYITKDYLAVLPAGSDVPVIYTATQPVEITLSQTSLEMQSGEYTRLTATVVPSAGTVTWSSSDESVATVVGGFVTAVDVGTAIITASVGSSKATCTVTVNNAFSGTNNGHAWVDLGLSVKWATMNVGASAPEEYGDYYAWGETSTKSTYSWSTYKYCNGSYGSLTKYCTSSDYGMVDNKTELELSDDVACQQWGSGWRMPTYDELNELRTECTWTRTSQNSVNGYKVSSKVNGNSIFLPAAGYRDYSSLYYAGGEGYFWSSSLSTSNPSYSDPNYGWFLGFNSGNVYVSSYYRDTGRSVRPVCP